MDFGKFRDKVTDKAGDVRRFVVRIKLAADYLDVGTQLRVMVTTEDLDAAKAAVLVAELRKRLNDLDGSIGKWVDTF